MPKRRERDTPVNPPAEIWEEQVLELLDSRVVLRRLGGSAPHLLFVHGWACRGDDWLPVARALPEATSWIVDLPGHGASTALRRAWDIPSLGVLIAELLGELDLPACVLVGHSMGAAVAVEAALRSDRVSRIVGIDSLTYPAIYPAQPPAAVEEAVAPLRGNFRGVMQPLVADLFPAGTRTELIRPIAEEMASVEPGPAVALLEELLRWDMHTALKSLTVPVDVVASRALLTGEGRRSLDGHARVRDVALGGHFFLREDPVGTAREIRALLLDGR